MEPTRILCAFSSLDRGGAESMCMNLYRSIDRLKVQFDFVKHTTDIGAFESEIESLGGRIYTAPGYRMINHYSYCKWWEQHLTQHPEHQIIHGHFFTISSVYFSVAKRMGRTTIAHSHASKQDEKNIKTILKLQMEKQIEKCSDYCFACGQQAGEWLFPHKPFTVLNNAVDAGQYAYSESVRAEVRNELNIAGEPVIGVVGSIKDVKNPMGILDIYEAIRSQKSKAKLLWVGDGPMRMQVEERIRKDGIQDSVILTGIRSDVNRLMQAMDAFILPSFSEGLPVVAVEAQAAGLQCFLSNQVSTEADLTGRCQFLPLNQPEQWAKQILSADLSRIDTKQQIIDAGYDIHTTAKWLENFYLNLANNRS